MLATIFSPENTQAMLQIVGSVVGILLSAVLVAIRRKTGVQIRVEEDIELDKLRSRLADAIWNGTMAAISRMPNASREEQVDAILDYLNRGLADTLGKLGADDDLLRERIEGVVAQHTRVFAPPKTGANPRALL